MKSILYRLYGRQRGDAALKRLSKVLEAFPTESIPAGKDLFARTDAILITYGDTLLKAGDPPLKTLHRFSREHLRDVFSGIHILPFFPYSSDDGFAVTEFQAVRPDLGRWADIRAIGKNFKLMVDVVANHVSAQSRWFHAYLADETGFTDLAIEVDPDVDLSGVTRPRALPLLTAFTKRSGSPVHVWTTFSADQIDLNYRSLDVLENMVCTLLFYLSQGARMIRLDAIAYLWKQIGTPCIHLPQTHDMVRLFRRILDLKAPGVVLVTETNVPHHENISYFGNGTDEAQMVYNFTLPPLLLYSLTTAKARIFSDWAQTLVPPSSKTAFLNFTASHDGIGVRPLEGILPSTEISRLADRIRKNGGFVSEKRNHDGSASPYELNITYLDALTDPDLDQDPFQVQRFLASQAVVLALPGVPAVYIHSLLGSQNWTEGTRITGQARTINRKRLSMDTLCAELDDPHSVRARIFFPYLDMVRIRNRQPAFHPMAGMQILDLDDRVFAIKRDCPAQTLIAVTNFSATSLTVGLPTGNHGNRFRDLLSGRRVEAASIPLREYQSVWLTA